ncbi:LolA family protein [Streptomyces sp.]|uniref:LolA family protein n=1 Tax=Streptomyces sp. TaxID=1931 RepID=UPI002F404E73
MARIRPARHPESDEPGGGGRGRKAVRYAVPAAVAGVAAATISLVPAIADTGDPTLPPLTAEQLLTKIAASDTRTVDGTVRISTDLGLPAALSGGATSGLFGGGPGAAGKPGGDGGGGADSPAAPQSRLTRLLSGTHRLHVTADGPDRQKVSVIEPAAEYSVIHNGTELWAYDSASDQAYHRTLPRPDHDRRVPQDLAVTPQDAARRVLEAADGTASVTVDGTARVAGHSAYELLVRPRHADATTVGAIRIAVDAKTGVPLKFTLTPKGGGKAVVDIGYTKVSFAKPAASTFIFKPPKGVKVTEGGSLAKADHERPGTQMNSTRQKPTVLGEGWDSIAVVKTPGGLPTGQDRNGEGADSLLNSFGSPVTGAFGSGTVFHTRLVNALLTDKGTLYVGAVTQSALTDAANAAAK